MASEISLKYLHPSVKTYITTENYNYDLSVNNELLFVADVFDHGVDNKLQQVNTVSEYLFKYGEPNFAKFGQAGYNVEKWLTNGGSAVIMRLLPDDAKFAHAVLNIQYKNATNGKTVITVNGEDSKINDVYLRPVVSYIGVNNTSEKLIESELAENRSGYPTTDGYIDNFIFAVYPEGRGEYYNDFGFRIRLNPSYDTTLTSRVYTFEVIKFTGTTYDIIDGPYFVTFDPDAIDPNSQKSMFIEDVVNSYSDFVKVKFNTNNYLKLASIINDEVDPYVIDIISGKSRILEDGSSEKYFSSVTGKEEDVHLSLMSYSTNGIALTKNGEHILNISNNDQTMKDIVDIADNNRRVIYNNQKFVTDYMRTFYNWLLIDRVELNLEKIWKGNIQDNIKNLEDSLLKEKAENLIYNNILNSDTTGYIYNGEKRFSDEVGKEGRQDTWYLKAQEVIDGGRETGFESDENGNPVYGKIEKDAIIIYETNENGDYKLDESEEKIEIGKEDKIVAGPYISTAEMINTITEDGYISETDENLISYYNNFMKYFQFVANYDIYNNSGFVSGQNITKLQTINDEFKANPKILHKLSSSEKYMAFQDSKEKYSDNKEEDSLQNPLLLFKNLIRSNEDSPSDLKIKSEKPVFEFTANEGIGVSQEDVIKTGTEISQNYFDLVRPFGNIDDSVMFYYFDEDCNYLRPVTVDKYFNNNGNLDFNNDYLKVYNFRGETDFIKLKNLQVLTFLNSKYLGLQYDNDRTGAHSNIFITSVYDSQKNENPEVYGGIPYFATRGLDRYFSYVGKIKAVFPNNTELPYQETFSNLFKLFAYNTKDSNLKYIDLGVQIESWYGAGYGKIDRIDYLFVNKIVNKLKENYNGEINLSDWKFMYYLMEDESDFYYTTIINQDGTTTKVPDFPNGAPTTWYEYISSVESTQRQLIPHLFSLENVLKDLYEVYIDNIELRKNEFESIEYTSYVDDKSKTEVENNEEKRKFEIKKILLYQRYMSALSFRVVSSLFVECETDITGTELYGRFNQIVPFYKISEEKYFINNSSDKFNPVFDEYTKNGLLTKAFNKVSSYASIISRELDGKGKDLIASIDKKKELKNTDYSLTTIYNFLVGGFEALVNNQGSITDYSNYASLKYLMKTINNNLDLRNTYLIILNVHKNEILDLSTDLAKLNASVILGNETLEELYSIMDKVVVETNFLINIVNTILSKTYEIKDLEVLTRADNGKPYAYYFPNDYYNDDSGLSYRPNQKTKIVDPLGIKNNINNFGTGNSIREAKGILPLLEKELINIIGENHLGNKISPIYGGEPLVEIYDDIKENLRPQGLDQETYETIYQILSEALSDLSQVHNIINTFVNEKYISEIVNTLLGTVNVNNTIIFYKGKNFTVNSLFEYYNQGLDPELTQVEVIDLINDAIETASNEYLPPYDLKTEVPIFLFAYNTIQDIKLSCSLAKENKDIIKNNIIKQDKVLATLNTLCYDNLTQDINSVISFSEGSDGSFTYDPSTSAKLKERLHRINDVRIKAYKGTWNPEVLNKDLFEFDHVLDANYEDAVKNAIITLARDERQDFFYWADTKIQNTIQDCLDWKTSFTNSTYFMSFISQSQVWYDEYTSRNISLTSTYLIADMLPRHITNYGVQYPMAGSRRGVVGGYLSMDWYPNEDQKENLYKNKVNYIERDITTTRIGAQNTNYTSGPLGSINNMLVLLKVKRAVEKIAKMYQFEFNTDATRGAMSSEINRYLQTWINNGACTVASANVYASDYDIIQKICRIDVTLKFTGVIERIVINIDAPAGL